MRNLLWALRGGGHHISIVEHKEVDYCHDNDGDNNNDYQQQGQKRYIPKCWCGRLRYIEYQRSLRNTTILS